jgi:Trk K+ transport system NAD-binding subunit
LVAELVTQYDAHVTAIFPPKRTVWAEKISQTDGVEVIESDRLNNATFTRAGLAQADALALVDQEDAGNVDAALLAQELCPDLRIVIRMFNTSLGERMTELLNNCAVLSAAAIAAPAFVAAALDETTTAPIRVAGRTVAGARRENVRPDDILCDLAVMGPRGSEPETLPPRVRQGDLVLAETKPAAAPRRRSRQNRMRVVGVIFGARLRVALLAFVALFVAGTATLAAAQDVSWSQAAYTALIAELSGNASTDAAGIQKIVLILLTMVSIVLIPALTAIIVDSVVKARLRLESGGLVEPLSNHMVVVGLGDVGTRIVRALYDEGVAIVAIERNPNARGVQVVRELGIPLIIGDASRNETLMAASVATCRALVVASTDDVTNLETALLGRAAKPDLRVVLRLFDDEFADRVKRAFNINISRSVSYLAAPAMAAAMLGRQIVATIPVRRHVLLVAEVPVGADSPLEHQPASSVMRDHEVRLLAIRAVEPDTAGGDRLMWRPSMGRPLRRTDNLVVVATRAGLSQLLSDTTTPAEVDTRTPYRLLEPWQIPHTRPTSAERPDVHPSFGPADDGSARPA